MRLDIDTFYDAGNLAFSPCFSTTKSVAECPTTIRFQVVSSCIFFSSQMDRKNIGAEWHEEKSILNFTKPSPCCMTEFRHVRTLDPRSRH